MTVKISKPALNLREELNKLDKPSGITGETLLRADTDADARATLGIDNFEQVSVSTDGVISADGLDVTGEITSDGIALGDNDKATFGAGDDLQIYHDGSSSLIKDAGTGNLIIQATDLQIANADNTANYIRAFNGGAVDLRYAGAAKLATTSTGIDVTGTATMDGLTVDGASDLNGNVTIGSSITTLLTGNDIEFQRAGNSYLSQTGGGALTIRTNDGVSNKVRMNLAANGDISFYEDTGTTPKFFWDASDEKLTIDGNGTTVTNLSTAISQAVLELNGNSQAGSDALYFGTKGGTGASYLQTSNGNGTASNYPLLLNPYGGNVGIGTDSPDTLLEVVGADPILTVRDTETSGGLTNATLRLAESGGGSALGNYWDINHTNSSHLRFVSKIGTTTTERLRIDSSGNLLVGTTSTTPQDGDHGFVARANGYTIVSVDDARPMLINRGTSDGELLNFRKDGTTVGSIGNNGNGLYINSVATGYLSHNGTRMFNWDSSQFYPQTNGAKDLGHSSYRWRDAYLSGGVYLGGTGAANKLDDYEEGTWTPTALNYNGTLTVDSATYVKVGALVTLKAKVSFDATADGSGVNLSSLPFVTTGVDKANGGFIVSSTVSSAARVKAIGTGSLYLVAADDSNVTYTTMASTSLEFVFIYETTA